MAKNSNNPTANYDKNATPIKQADMDLSPIVKAPTSKAPFSDAVLGTGKRQGVSDAKKLQKISGITVSNMTDQGTEHNKLKS